ncbi:uncharacterized protein PSFLO_00685 [Pseudozyma flocculosa]|uniref:Uncharacterized protein n=1 Tax=Pseudozyma flocculosa TaxID=84751 RepID=A0A5C3ESC3_9BASI|nr:uncharacterized protein PSFLO_00685 [Pseudozyma flocculosa]
MSHGFSMPIPNSLTQHNSAAQNILVESWYFNQWRGGARWLGGEMLVLLEWGLEHNVLSWSEQLNFTLLSGLNINNKDVK